MALAASGFTPVGCAFTGGAGLTSLLAALLPGVCPLAALVGVVVPGVLLEVVPGAVPVGWAFTGGAGLTLLMKAELL